MRLTPQETKYKLLPYKQRRASEKIESFLRTKLYALGMAMYYKDVPTPSGVKIRTLDRAERYVRDEYITHANPEE